MPAPKSIDKSSTRKICTSIEVNKDVFVGKVNKQQLRHFVYLVVKGT